MQVKMQYQLKRKQHYNNQSTIYKLLDSMVIIKGIKAACKLIMNAGQELTTRKNFICDTKTNELIAEVKIKDENGKRY